MKKSRAKNFLIIVLTIILTLSMGMNIFQLFQMNATRKTLSENTEKVTFYEENYSPMYEHFSGLSIAEFEAKVASGARVVVYFGRPDCGDCLSFEPTFEELIQEMKLDNKLYYVNVKWKREGNEKEWNTFKDTYKFTQTPAFAVYEFGEQQSMIEWTTKGLTKSDLKAWLESNGFGEQPAV